MSGRKLRLLLFEDCNRSCDGCCNQWFDLRALPVCRDYTPYDLIMLTGGEPMLKPDVVHEAVTEIQAATTAPVVLYTAHTGQPEELVDVLDRIHGLTVTLHEQGDAEPFSRLAAYMQEYRGTEYMREKSLRVNIFAGVEPVAWFGKWEIKENIDWIPNSPLPPGEDFMRYGGTCEP